MPPVARKRKVLGHHSNRTVTRLTLTIVQFPHLRKRTSYAAFSPRRSSRLVWSMIGKSGTPPTRGISKMKKKKVLLSARMTHSSGGAPGTTSPRLEFSMLSSPSFSPTDAPSRIVSTKGSRASLNYYLFDFPPGNLTLHFLYSSTTCPTQEAPSSPRCTASAPHALYAQGAHSRNAPRHLCTLRLSRQTKVDTCWGYVFTGS